MRQRAIVAAIGAACVVSAASMAQGPGNPGAASNTAPANPTLQATVETADLALVYPDRYAVPVVLEPNRRVFLTAPSDGLLKSVSAAVGATVRENQEVAQLDRVESAARVKVADAAVKEAQAEVARAASGEGAGAVAQARLDGAKARAELAQLELDRCTLRAPFPGKVLSAPVSPGQYVSKGTNLADLADYSVLKVLVPVDRTSVKAGADLELIVEGKPVVGKVTALVPLPEGFAPLRELAIPWAAAWVNLNNADGALEPGQRVRGPSAPTQPITALPARAVRSAEDGSSTVQIVRRGYILDVPVKVIGDAGFERTQVVGAFIPTDAAIVESSIPMSPGTVIAFRGESPVSGAAGARSGYDAELTLPPGVSPGLPVGSRVAPIGRPNANVPKAGAARNPAAGAGKAASKPAAKTPAPKSNAAPF